MKMCLKVRIGLLALAMTTTVGHSQTCTVNWNDGHQRIDGFGGAVVFLNPASMDPVTDANMDTLFNSANANQLGLSLLRVRIAPDNTWANALSDGKKAVARGGRILATPWTPPASMKSNGNTIGGSLLAAQYANYAAYLNGFAAYMATNGAPLAAISVQNEPDATVNYESCSWTATQFQTFFHNNAAAITNAPVMMPESESYNTSFSEPTLNDPVAVTNVTFIGGHLYGNGNAGVTVVDYPNAHNKGKPTWMTEFLVNDQTIGTAITTAQQIHNCLTTGNMSAYIWWKCLGDANGLVNASGVPQKRGFVMAQWSRFVRPAYYRIGATNTGTALISAYKDTNSPNFAIVAINTNASAAISQTFNLTNFPTVSSVTPWITSATLSLSNQTPVTVNNASFTYTLPALSVVTFVGQAAVPVTTTVGLTTSSNPSTYGNAVTFTATVRTNGVAVGGISGETVTFYDGAVPLGTGTVNGSGQAAYTTSATQLSAVTHSITAGYGGDAVYAGSTNSPALSQTVNKATLTAGLTGTVSKPYDGTTTATLAAGNYTLSGVVSGDTVTLNNPTSGTYDTRNQGTGKTVTVTGLAISGVSATNYTLSSTSASAAVGAINKTNITVTAAANGKPYDGTASAAATPTITSGSVQSGDTAGFVETYDTRNQGTGKTLTPSGSVTDGNSGNNYNYSFVTSANGTINAATLTYTANPANMIYGSAVPGLSGSVGGFVGGDTQASATTGTLAFTTPATSSSSVGLYAINGSGLTANNGNYTFVQAGVNATALSILPLVTPVFVGPGISADSGGWQLSFSAQAGQSYQVLATGDLTLPVSQWTVLTNGIFGAGTVTITDSSATNLQRFYQIVSP
jgi:glucuronoarabinoxylan endo-1,4-beta-xylanase